MTYTLPGDVETVMKYARAEASAFNLLSPLLELGHTLQRGIPARF
jgi:hypothetical protein